MAIRDLIDWFAGGRDGYMTLVHCMNHDYVWIWITVALDLSIAAGYLMIALHWWSNERTLSPSPARSALRAMKNIFVLCGICGYLFIPIKMVWPAWRLYDLFLVGLSYSTWRYALRSRDLRVVYNELGRSSQLAHDLEVSREEGRLKTQFLNALSHDIKTPLNGLSLQAELAELNLAANDAEGLREALVQIKSCARTTAELLNSFLELGRLDWAKDVPRVSEFGALELLDELAARSRVRAAAKGLELAVEAPPGLALRTDRVKLMRVLDNLLDNALKFCQEGGIRLLAGRGPGGVEVAVVDTGEGIAASDQARIFEEFVQVHNRERDSQNGFGLGLAISRRLSRQLGGELTVESQPGRGSRFTVHLPPDAGVDAPAGPGPADPRGGRHVGGPGRPAAAPLG